MTKNTGGPAYPMMTKWMADHNGKAANTGYEVSEYSEGMSLRDHFAGLAMQGYIAYMGCGPDKVDQIGADDNEPNKTVIARCAYKFADAMLAEREKGND